MSDEGKLTLKKLEAAFQRMREWEDKPNREFHHPRCPKWLAAQEGRVEACRCGGAPLEAIFADELAKGSKP